MQCYDAMRAQEVESKMPRKFKKKRMMTGTNGEGMGWEEYYDYQFPDDESKPANLKILEMAQKWKQSGAGEVGFASLKLGGGGTKRKQGDLEGSPEAVAAAGGEGDDEEIDLDDEEMGGEKEEGPALRKRRLDGPGTGDDDVEEAEEGGGGDGEEEKEGGGDQMEEDERKEGE